MIVLITQLIVDFDCPPTASLFLFFTFRLSRFASSTLPHPHRVTHTASSKPLRPQRLTHVASPHALQTPPLLASSLAGGIR